MGPRQRFHHFFFDGPTSWFNFEELTDDWLDLSVLEAEKRGPALRNRLVGDAEVYKGLLDREPLKAADGVKYFRIPFHRIESFFCLGGGLISPCSYSFWRRSNYF